MISKKLIGKSVLGLCLMLGAGGLSPLHAHRSIKSTHISSAAVVAAPANSVQLQKQRYCIAEAINTRIPKKICKTAQEWSAVGVDLVEAR